MSGFVELPANVPLDHELAGGPNAPVPQSAAPDPPAAPTAPPRMWTKEEEQRISEFMRTAKTPQEIVDFSAQLGKDRGIAIPLHGAPGQLGATEAIQYRDRNHGAVPTSYVVPGFAKGQVQPEQVPDGMAELPADAKVDYGTLSGLSPDEIRRKFESNPEAEGMRRAVEAGTAPLGMSPLETHGFSAGLDTDISAGVHTLANLVRHPVDALKSKGASVADAYHEGRTDALARIDYLHMLHPNTAPVEEIAGAVANPLGMEARTPLALARVGAGYGAVSGFEDGNGSLGERALNAGKGAAIGAVAAPVAGAAIKGAAAIPNAVRAAVKDVPLSEVGEAARRQGIDMLPADAGGPVTRALTAFSMQTPLGAPPIIRAAQRASDRGAEVVASHAAAMGAPQDAEAAGQIASEGARKYVALSSRIGGRMYDAAAAKAGDATVDPALARQMLDDQIGRVSAVPAGTPGRDAQLTMLQAQRAGLNGRFPVQAIRDMRTQMFVDPDLRGTPAETMTKQVINAAAQDAENSLRAAGKNDAADAFAAADAYWRNRLETIDHVIEPIIGRNGNKSGEQVIRALNGAMTGQGGGGNNARVAAFVRALPDEEQGTVRASLLTPLGRDKDGNFSLSRFATDWQAIGGTAKKALFSPEARAALDDLTTVGMQAKASQKYANHSNTVRGVVAERTFGSVATGATIGLGVTTLGKALALQGGAGLLLSSPRFARWLARAPLSKVASEAYMDRLSRIAAAEPRLAGPIAQFRQSLMAAANDNVSSAAASGGDQQQQSQDQ